MIAASSSVAVGAVWAYVAAGLLIAGLSALVTAIYRLVRGLAGDVHGMKDALITPEPTRFTPEPAPGIIDVVKQHDKIIKSNKVTLEVLVTGTKALLDQRVVGKAEIDVSSSLAQAWQRLENEKDRLASENTDLV